MKCPECHKEFPIEQFETYKRGRHIRIHFKCDKCGHITNKKIKTINYNKKNDTIKKGCSVRWGKDKTHKMSWER